MLTRDRAAVIVAAYNAASTIEACLRSIVSMDHDLRREIIVVDNGSTDSTREVVSRFGDAVRLVRESRRGPAAARNRGIRETSAEWIAFTDADCVVERDWLARLIPEGPPDGIGVAGGRILSVEPCNRIERFGEIIHDHRNAIERPRPYAMTGNWASPRAVLLEAGLFDETLLRGSDADMSFRIHALGYRLVYRDDAVVRHRNERTFAGLFREGRMHGMGGMAMRSKPVHAISRDRRRTAGRNIAGGLRRLVVGDGVSRFDALCFLVFDIGKLVGEMSAERRPGR